MLDQGGNLVQQGSFFIPDGESRVPLDFVIPIGNNYSMRVNGTPNLYRNNASVTFPYEKIDTLSIHSSSSGNNYYYFFYDWEIAVGANTCTGPTESHTIEVEICAGLDDVDLSAQMRIFPNPNQGQFTFNFEVPGTTDFELSVVDLLGKTVYTEAVRNVSGSYSRTISLNQAPHGLYFVNVDVAGYSYFHKLVIQ